MKTIAFLALAMLMMSAGCAEIGVFGSKTETFTGSYSMEIPAPRADMLDLIASVGKSMGYSVSALDKKNRMISLSSGSSVLTGVLIGKVNRSMLTAKVSPDGRSLDIGVSDSGNFGTGGQAAADEQAAEFKARLAKRL
jgi:hypothetical protein